jgi:hypothetical protein
MNSKQFAQLLLTEVQNLERQGTSNILCSNLVVYLKSHIDHQPTSSPEIEIEKEKAFLQNWIESNKHKFESEREMFRSVISSGQNALKTGFLLNGGASLAMLAYIGQHGENYTKELSLSLLYFVWGTICISLSSAMVYLCQRVFSDPDLSQKKWASYLDIVTICVGFISFVFFILGMYVAYEIFSNFP